MQRVVRFALLVFLCAIGGAQASSFVVLGDDKPLESPSIITLPAASPSLGAAASSAPSASIQIVAAAHPTEAPSIVALGTPPRPVSHETVAAVETPPRHARPMPRVIRGGVTGGPFQIARPSTAESVGDTASHQKRDTDRIEPSRHDDDGDGDQETEYRAADRRQDKSPPAPVARPTAYARPQ